MQKNFCLKAGKNAHCLGRRIGSVSLSYRAAWDQNSGSFCRFAAHVSHKGKFFVRPPSPRWGNGDKNTVADGPFARPDRMSRVEAVLFLAREPLPSRKIAQLADLADGTEARTMVRGLNKLLDGEGCSFRVVEVAGGFQLMTRAQFSPWLCRLHSASAEVRLSGPALETLAVIAYRQPVLRAAIEAIRGVQCGEILRQLMERELVKIVGRSEDLGRPFLYGTTKQFLQAFGLRGIDELPRQEWFKVAELAESVEEPDTAETEDSEVEC